MTGSGATAILATQVSFFRQRQMLRRHAPALLFGAALLIIWEVVGRSDDLLVLPPFSRVLEKFSNFLLDGTFFDSLAVSLLTLVLGMAIAIVLGIGIGAAMARWRSVRYALDVYVNAAMAAPMIAFVPVFILLFGIGYPTRVLVVVMFATFPIIVNTFTGIRTVDPSFIEMARSFGANERQLFWRVRVPAAFVLIRSGLRLGTIRGVKGLINGEVLIASVGLGALVQRYGNALGIDSLYAIVLFLVIIVALSTRTVDVATRRLVRH